MVSKHYIVCQVWVLDESQVMVGKRPRNEDLKELISCWLKVVYEVTYLSSITTLYFLLEGEGNLSSWYFCAAVLISGDPGVKEEPRI